MCFKAISEKNDNTSLKCRVPLVLLQQFYLLLRDRNQCVGGFTLACWMFPGKHWPPVWAVEQHSWYSSFTVCIHHRREHTVERWRVMRWGWAPFLFSFMDSLENGTGEHFRFLFRFFSLSLLSGSTRHNTSKTDWLLSLAAPKKRKTS